MSRKKIAIFTGAGISVESGVEAFRSGDKPLWGEYDVEEVATPDAWKKNPQLVTDFYNKRRIQLADVNPNDAHRALVRLEDKYDVTIITQNIDDLHERAGSSNVFKLHGDLRTVRSAVNPNEQYDWEYKAVDFEADRAKNNARLRPHVVWFGEYPDIRAVKTGYEAIYEADILLIIGTSLQISYTIDMLSNVRRVDNPCEVYYIDPSPAKYLDAYGVPVVYIEKDAVEGVTEMVEILMNR
jgi:NAD-dependent deacetylase